jgi:hypothetical protein
MPERHDRLAARCRHRVEVLASLDAPAQRLPQGIDQRVAGARNGRNLEALSRGGAPVFSHIPMY